MGPIINFAWLFFSIPSAINTFLTDRLCRSSLKMNSDTNTDNVREQENVQDEQGEETDSLTSTSYAKYKSVNIPNYFEGELEDSIELQISSLSYAYRLFRINSLGPFLKAVEGYPGTYKFDYVRTTQFDKALGMDSTGFICNRKLNTIYNVDRFKEAMLEDPYRVLIDYIKNKFRAMLILSGYPAESNRLPELNRTQQFSFVVLRPEDPDERYVEVLTKLSGIYHEHRVSMKLKRKVALRVISRQRERTKTTGKFNKDDRSAIIKSYLQKLSFHVQVERIYKATLKSKQREARDSMMTFSTQKSIQPYGSLKIQQAGGMMNIHTKQPPSPSPLGQSSPKRESTNDAMKQTETNEKAPILTDELENIYISDTNSEAHLRVSDSESQASSSSCSTLSKYFSPEEKKLFYEQSKMAVRIRIERERLYLV